MDRRPRSPAGHRAAKISVAALVLVAVWPAAAMAQPEAAAPTAQTPTSRPQIVVIAHEARGDLPTLGPRYAPVTIDAFLDFNEAVSRVAYRHLLSLAERHPRRLRIIFRVIAKPAQGYLAEAALEGFAQGRFHELAGRIFAEGGLARDKVAEVAHAAKVDYAGIERAWADERHARTIEDNVAYARRRRVMRTPALLFNGIMMEGSIGLGLEPLEAEYDGVYKSAQIALAEGVPLDRLYEHLLAEHDLSERPLPITAGAVDGANDRTMTAPGAISRLIPRVPEGGYAAGPEDAPVRVVVFCNFSSRNCASYHRVLREIQNELGDQVRMEFRHFITAETKRKQIRLRHIAARCADQQGAFWRFHDEFFSKFYSLDARQDLVTIIDNVVKSIDIDMTVFDACMEAPGHAQAIEDEIRAARKAGIEVVPTTVIGGRVYTGTKSLLELRHIIQQQRLPGLLEQYFPPWKS